MNTTEHFESTQRRYLRDELRGIYCRKDEALEQHFHVRDDNSPETVEEALERIKAGKYQLKDKKERGLFSHWTDGIRWRDPSHEKDLDGYKAAAAKMKKAYEHTSQDLMIDPLDKAKKAMREFESATFH